MGSAARVTWREWLGLGAGLLAAGSLFLPWSALSAGAPDVEDGLRSLPGGQVVRTAWNSDFLSWFPPILLLLTGLAVALFGQVAVVRDSGLPQLWLISAGVVLLLTTISWFAITWQFDSELRALFTAGGIVVGPGVGRYLGMFAAVGSLVAAILDTRAARAAAPS